MSPVYEPEDVEVAIGQNDDIVFFDDFICSAYDNQTWSLIGGSFNQQSALCGRTIMRTPTGVAQGTFYVSDPAYTCANIIRCDWRGRMIPAANGSVECGLLSGDQADWVCWIYAPGTSANFECYCGNGAGSTRISSGVVADTNDHIFRVYGRTGAYEFWLDGVLRQVITSNVSTQAISPYVWGVGGSAANSDFNVDWVRVTGER